MFSTLVAFALAAPIDRSWLERLDPATIPAAERFAWQPPELVGILGTHRGRHWGTALAASVSPDGKVIASGGTDGRVRLWDARDLLPLASLEGYRSSDVGILFSPDGKLLASVCDRESGEEQIDPAIRLWRVDGKDTKLWTTLPPVTRRIVGASFLDGGKALWTADQAGAVRVWDLRGKEPIERISCTIHADKPDQQPFFVVITAALSPDGKTVVAVTGLSTAVSVWDIGTGKKRATLTQGYGWVRWLEFAPDSSSVRFLRLRPDRDTPVTDPDAVSEWDLTKEKPVERVNPRGGLAVIASKDRMVRTRVVGDATEVVREDRGKERVIGRLAKVTVTRDGLSADGRILTGCTESRVRVWDVGDDGLRERVLDDFPTEFLIATAFSPTSDKLYGVRSGDTTGGEVFLTWDLKGTQPVPTTVPRQPMRGWGRVVFGPSGVVAAVDAKPGGATFDVATGKAKTVLPGASKNPYHQTIHAMAFTPDGKRLATAVSASRFEGQQIVLDWHAVVWDVSAAKATTIRELTPGGPRVTALAFGADGNSLAAGHQDGSLAWWDITADPPRLIQAWKPHDREVSAVAVSLDGKEVASGTSFGEVRWGKVGESSLVVHTDADRSGRVDRLAFTPNGRQLLAMFNTGRFIAADAAGKIVTDFRPEYAGFASGAQRGFGLAADGRHIAVPTVNGLVYVLRLRP